MITITQKAAEKVQEIAAAEELQGQGLRLKVIGGGCAGFSYDLYFEDKPGEEDEIYEDKGKEFRWRLKASNGQVVAASSGAYAINADCEMAIDPIKKCAQGRGERREGEIGSFTTAVVLSSVIISCFAQHTRIYPSMVRSNSEVS